ncbi:MAG: hypothetical protein EPO40_03135 [Myxococcaceae bacterium]|nr:MAG: hypothetical protein EPO40_03135 [Myxococcaceae bacterium]
MANPNLPTLTAAVAAVLFDGQLASGDTDFTVGTGKAWKLESLSLCNTTGSAVVISVSVKPSTGGTFRKVVSGYSLASNAAGDGTNSLSLDAGKHLPRLLPEGAVVRINAGTGTAVDVLATGTVLG